MDYSGKSSVCVDSQGEGEPGEENWRRGLTLLPLVTASSSVVCTACFCCTRESAPPPQPQPPTLIPKFPHIHHHQRPAGKMAQHSNMVHSPLITYVSMLSLLTLCPPFVILLYVLPPSLFDLSIYLLFPSVSSILHSFIHSFQIFND